MAISSSQPRSRRAVAAGAQEHPVEAVRPPRTRPVIEFRGVSMRYPSGDVGLDQASFSLHREDFVFLVGATGSGKSTVMRLLIKELEPTEGLIHAAGHDLGAIKRNRIAYYRRNIGVVFQDFKLLPRRTVYDNVAYALRRTGGPRD